MKNIISPDYGVIADRHKLVIGVVGIGSGAGATFIAMGLALLVIPVVELVKLFQRLAAKK